MHRVFYLPHEGEQQIIWTAGTDKFSLFLYKHQGYFCIFSPIEKNYFTPITAKSLHVCHTGEGTQAEAKKKEKENYADENLKTAFANRLSS